MNARDQIEDLKRRMARAIVGQETVVERLIIGLLANGNLLVEGLPGLAKTRAIKALARNLEADFSRVGSFQPDDHGPPTIRPSLPGADYFPRQEGFSAYVFGGVEGRVVGRNIFLNGNTF